MKVESRQIPQKLATRLKFAYFWYKKLSFGISRPIWSYLIGSFENFLEEILIRNFLGIEVVLKLCFISSLEMVVGRFERTVAYLHITVAVGGPLTA